MPPLSPKFQNPGFLQPKPLTLQLESVQSNDAAYVAAKADRFRNFDLEAKTYRWKDRMDRTYGGWLVPARKPVVDPSWDSESVPLFP